MIHFLHVRKECFGSFWFILSLIHSFFFTVTSGFLLLKKKKKKRNQFKFSFSAYWLSDVRTGYLGPQGREEFCTIANIHIKTSMAIWHRVRFGSIQLNPIPICACVLRRSFFGMTQSMHAFNKMNHKSINTSTTTIKP